MTRGLRKLTSPVQKSLALAAVVRDVLFGRDALASLVRDVLCGGDGFLMGVHRKSRSAGVFYRALLDWGVHLDRKASDVLASLESCIRQNILMSLIPHR